MIYQFTVYDLLDGLLFQRYLFLRNEIVKIIFRFASVFSGDIIITHKVLGSFRIYRDRHQI